MEVTTRGEKMEELPEELQSFLRQHPALQVISGNKVRFSVTGHELPCRLSDLQSFTEGKKYQRLSRVSTFDFSSFEPHIVPSTKNGRQLFCRLTLRHINKVPEHVQRHVQGKRYLRALHRYNECQKKGVEFVPASLQKKKPRQLNDEQSRAAEGHVWEPKVSHSEDSDSGDSMSDLYPADMFSKKNTGEEEKNGTFSSASDEEMEVERSLHGNQRKRRQVAAQNITRIGLTGKGIIGPNSRIPHTFSLFNNL